MVVEGGESTSTTMGVDLGELKVAIVVAAHAVHVVVDVHRWHWQISLESCSRGGQQ